MVLKEKIEVQCDQCEYKCYLNIQLKKHKNTVHGLQRADMSAAPFSEPFPCEWCGLVFSDFSLLKEHVSSYHAPPSTKCRYCSFTCEDKDMFQNHMIESHEEYVILHTMASQIDQATDKFVEFDTFKTDVLNVMNKLLENQNAMKQELFLVRNNKTCCKRKVPDDVHGQTHSKDDEKVANKHEKQSDKTSMKDTNDKKHAGETRRKKKDGGNKEVVWIGSSISKALDINKFEKDTKANVKFVKAYGIKEDSGHYYPKANVTDTVDKVLQTCEPDTLVLQTGSIEISNIDTKKAYMDTDKDIELYKKEWAAKVEEDSSNLFDVAIKAAEKYPEMKVVIVKRLPRYDPASSDPKGIKQQLSKFSNHVYDQLWFKKGCVKNIFIVDIDLNCSTPGYLRDMIYGDPKESSYDGLHLRGQGSYRHLTYRSVIAIGHIIRADLSSDCQEACPQPICQQTQFKSPSRSVRARHVVSDRDIRPKSNQRTQDEYEQRYSVPTSNIYEHLNY